MSGKKSPPALYELYHKGKKSRGGLFGRRKKLNIQNAYDIPAVPAPGSSQPAGSVKKPLASYPTTPADVSPVDDGEDDSNLSFEVDYGRITMVMPVWLFVMLVLAVLTSLLAAYKVGMTANIGKKAVVDESAGSDNTEMVEDNSRLDAEPSPEMIAALNSDPITGLVQNSEVLESNNANTAGNAEPVEERPVRCLIVYGGETDLTKLKYVQDYFKSQGMELEIVKRSGTRGYILVTKSGFVSSRDEDCIRLKSKILSIGKSYIVNWKSGWPRINERTFDSAYPIDTSKLEYDWR